MESTLESKRNVLEQLTKLREVVRRKYELVKRGKSDFKEAMNETFEPIVKPLKKLVDLSATKNKKINNSTLKSTNDTMEDDITSDGEDSDTTVVNEVNDDSGDVSLNSDEEDDDNDNIFSEINDDIPSEKKQLQKYLEMMKKKKPELALDHWYGVRQSHGILMIGDSKITFNDNEVTVKNIKYPKSVGLLELLFKKNPDDRFFSKEDLSNYKQILETTNGHRMGWKKDGIIRRLRSSKKFQLIIKPLFHLNKNKNSPSRSSGSMKLRKTFGEGLPKYKIARSGYTNTDFIYYDDPNELVDRLKLLVSEQRAGNYAHTNEIHSILEELREAGYIY